MAGLTLSTLETLTRERMGDYDGSNLIMTQATLDRFLNRGVAIITGLSDDRPYVVPANAGGWTIAVGAQNGTATTPAKPIRHFLHVFPAGSASSTEPSLDELERWPIWAIHRARGDDSALYGAGGTGTTGTISACAVRRIGTATAANVGGWYGEFWRSPIAQTFLAATVLVEPTALSAGTDVPDLDLPACYALVDMTAAIGERILGQPNEFVQEIVAAIPDQFKGVFKEIESETFPGKQT